MLDNARRGKMSRKAALVLLRFFFFCFFFLGRGGVCFGLVFSFPFFFLFLSFFFLFSFLLSSCFHFLVSYFLFFSLYFYYCCGRASQFFRPAETFHVPTRMFYEHEVLRSNEHIEASASCIVGKCVVLFLRDYLKYMSTEFGPKDTYVCASRYSAKAKAISAIKSWQAPAIEPALTMRRKPLVGYWDGRGGRKG